MKRGKLVVLMIGVVVSGMTSVYAQSKKEKIEMLTRKMDSLEKVLSVKNGPVANKISKDGGYGRYS